jgi:hypothetical protein
VHTAQAFPLELRSAKPTETAFSATEIVYHMIAVEQLWQGRLKRLTSGESNRFDALDPDADARSGNYNSLDFETGLTILQNARRETNTFVRGLGPEALALEGIHSKYGPMNILRILEIMEGHDRNHAAQFARTLFALSSRADPESSSDASGKNQPLASNAAKA